VKHNNIPIFIPELACGHKCVFCNQNKISGVSNVPTPNEIPQIIDKYLDTIPKQNYIEIAFFGGSFTGIPIYLQEQYLQIASSYVKQNKVNGIRISTRPDYINVEILNMLKNYNVTAIELGAQSTNDLVLQKSGRGHNFEHIKNAVKLIKKYNFELGLQMMLGLPEDSFENSFQTAKDIIELKADTTRIYPTIVVKNTVLEKLYNLQLYKPLTLEEAVEWTKPIYLLFEKNNVNVLRVGLHQSEELIVGKSLVAGPFHQSFKEMVMTLIWFDIIKNKIKDIEPKNLIITVNHLQINYAIGYKSYNKLYFKNDGYNIKFLSDSTFEKYEINIVGV